MTTSSPQPASGSRARELLRTVPSPTTSIGSYTPITSPHNGQNRRPDTARTIQTARANVIRIFPKSAKDYPPFAATRRRRRRLFGPSSAERRSRRTRSRAGMASQTGRSRDCSIRALRPASGVAAAVMLAISEPCAWKQGEGSRVRRCEAGRGYRQDVHEGTGARPSFLRGLGGVRPELAISLM
jgi:hypothetical protein